MTRRGFLYTILVLLLTLLLKRIPIKAEYGGDFEFPLEFPVTVSARTPTATTIFSFRAITFLERLLH